MIIHNRRILQLGTTSKICCDVDDKVLWYEFPAIYEKFLVDTYDCFLIAILPIAMKQNKNLIIKGKVSEKLLHNINIYLMKILNIIIPQCKIIKIIPDEIFFDKIDNKFVGCGLSCGVDSFACLQEYYNDKDCLPSYKISHVTNFHCGGSGSLVQYNKRLSNVKNCLENTELNLITATSNVMKINNFSHVQIHILRNCSVVLLFQKLFSKYFYASAFAYEDCKIFKNCNAISFAEPYIVPLLSTQNTEFICHGSQYKRIDKINLIKNNILCHNYLDVCVWGTYVEENDNLNCSSCWKCMRTMLALDYYKVLHKYDKVFDLQKYKTRKESFLNKLDINDPLQKEIMELYKIKY